MILIVFKLFFHYGSEKNPVAGPEDERFFPGKIKELYRCSADQSPASGAVQGIDAGLLVGNTHTTGRHFFPGSFFLGV